MLEECLNIKEFIVPKTIVLFKLDKYKIIIIFI